MGGWIRVKCLYCLQTIAELHNVKIRVKEQKKKQLMLQRLHGVMNCVREQWNK